MQSRSPIVRGTALAADLAEFTVNDQGYVFTNACGLSYQAHT